MGMLVALGIWHKLKFLPFLRFGVLLCLIYFLKHKRHHLTLENKNYCKLTSWLCLESKTMEIKCVELEWGGEKPLEYVLFSLLNAKSDVAKHESGEAPLGRLKSMI